MGMKNGGTEIRPLRWRDFILLFGLPTLLNLIACRMMIPFMTNHTSLPSEVVYFISVGGIVLMPMFFWALFMSGRDVGSFRLSDILRRMRFKAMSGADWGWSVAGFVALSLMSFLIAKLIMPKLGIDSTPFFFQNMPLDKAHRWILYVWPLFFFFNIFGEEFLWRGYIQPRQELLNGRMTWFVHGIFWSVWHIPMGLDLVMTAIPILFILPAIVQIRKNTTISLVVHAVFGGFGFLVLALGGVH